jgi:exodeoxyribonuclease-5
MTSSVAGALSIRDLFAQHPDSADQVILCATNRLARNLRLGFGQQQSQRGATLWPTLQATTVEAWLHDLGEQIALLGEVPFEQVPARVMTPFQAGLVWQQSIEAVGCADQSLPLFDLPSLARTAAEAHALINTWRLRITEASGTPETRQFLAWRQHFGDACRKHDWLDGPAYQQRVTGWLERGAGSLPPRVVFAGFDTLSPDLLQLQAVLASRGVEVVTLEFSAQAARNTRAIACVDADAECRAAAAWARDWLADNPAARLGLVVADLEARRAMLLPLLDAALDRAALTGSDDAAPGTYNVSLGLPLHRHGMVRTALALLRLLGRPQGTPISELGELLRLAYWSADQGEADLRALVDARLREWPAQDLGIDGLRKQVQQVALSLGKARDCKLLQHLKLLGEVQQELAQTGKPGVWAGVFREALLKLGWPGERSLSSSEFQTRGAFFELLDALAELDDFLGTISIGSAANTLARLCREKIFQPKTLGQPALQVLGLLEATGAEFDALWVMGMNDQHWPPPARPNPLLPAELQRHNRTPGASADVQGAFAHDIHQGLLRSAPDISFSYAEQEGERELRPSPLIAGLPAEDCKPWPEQSSTHLIEYLEDHQAPALAPGEQVSGGSGLLKAQAICPAWAFYRYRLGAKQLATPAEGLDASQRGYLLHAMLEAFWTEIGDSAGLAALDTAQLAAALAAAAELALSKFEATLGVPLTPTRRQLESRRLSRLGLEWLTLEGNRAPFKVLACEEKHAVTLGQLQIRLVIDRIDALLADGQRIVLDYKTGASLDYRSWFGMQRITEPQLPLYASVVLAETEQAPVVAVAFAKVRSQECRFTGIAAAADILPTVATTAPEAWQELLASWQGRLEAIADEIQRGVAAVRFADEKALTYCEVLPLLRLAERKLQFEQRQVNAA